MIRCLDSPPRWRTGECFGIIASRSPAHNGGLAWLRKDLWAHSLSRPHRSMIVHLLDGTYELFRHFYGLRRAQKGADPPLGAVRGRLHGVLEMIEGGAAPLGVATDHVIESFRNGLWPGYKTGAGVERALKAQFHPLEEALAAMGVAVWPMVELEADDALAAAARLAAAGAGGGEVPVRS